MKLQDEVFDVIVVGGGAAGMMAAGTAAARGKKVLILEKNRRLGEKLRITGGGRCNVTNAEYDLHALLAHYGSAADFLYSPFSQFGVQSTFDFFAAHKLPLVIQARKRAFPNTEKASDVTRVMEKFVKESGVLVKESCPVIKVHFEKNDSEKGTGGDADGQAQKIISGLETNQGIFHAKAYIFATGGVSHPETGSTGDGFNWLRSLGHTVKNPTPTIVPIEVADEWVKSLAGVSLSFMKITFFSVVEQKDDKVLAKKAFSETGKVLFTHFGLSGPLILNAAGKVNDLLTGGQQVIATIDAYPDTDLGALDRSITSTFDKNKNKDFKNIFKEVCPAGTADAIVTLLSFDTTKKVHSITKEERKEIARLLKALPITIVGLMGFDRAVVADGGVPLAEVDMKTMRSTLFSNLYLTGDLLHVNRPSGGYSLQLCWTTGFVAGENVGN